MKFKIYILGFLKRYGSLHGYKLRHYLKEVSDFAKIKHPTIYYHLDKMEAQGFVSSITEQEGNRPERQVFSITEKGNKELLRLLKKTLLAQYNPEFDIDAVLYFFYELHDDEIISELQIKIEKCKQIICHIDSHKKEVLGKVPASYQLYVRSIFNHHKIHYLAELEWLEETSDDLKK